ncbi:MAG: capping complex subunit for YIEGIA [Desulfurispora sp.]|uniref:capping complex subunit for YIEGIA n=1 Tax=Desulfurispora sp. TaxID=3014275 RepID=UPI0040491A4F
MVAQKKILAIITSDMQIVAGGAPIFFAPDPVYRDKLARSLSRILDAMVHDLENGTYIVVAH